MRKIFIPLFFVASLFSACENSDDESGCGLHLSNYGRFMSIYNNYKNNPTPESCNKAKLAAEDFLKKSESCPNDKEDSVKSLLKGLNCSG